MSPTKRKGNAVWVMREALRYSLPVEEPKYRKTSYDTDKKKYVTRNKPKIKKTTIFVKE